MDSANPNNLFRINRQSFGPKCYVRSSDRCRHLFDLYGITPAEYLRPFALAPRKTELSSITGKRRTVNNFQTTMIDEREYKTPNKQQIDVALSRVLESSIPNLQKSQNEIRVSLDVNSQLQNENTFWFDKGSDVILEQCRFSHQFCFTDQPVYLVNFITTEESDPPKTIKYIESEASIHLKEVFKNNPNDVGSEFIPNANFIIYDSSNQRQTELAQKIQQDLRQKYPHYFNRAIPINSPGATIELSAWEQYLETRYFAIPQGAFIKSKKILSSDDFSKIMEIFGEFVLTNLVPSLENKLRGFHQSYIQQKKNSFSTTFKKLFNSNDQKKPESGGAYTMTPFELLTRNIGDILYLLRDYETAIEFYKISSENFKNKSYRHYASATEMMALSLVMSHQEFKVVPQKTDGQTILNQMREAILQYNNQLNHIHFSLRATIFKIQIQYLYDKFDPVINQQVLDVAYLINERSDSSKANQYPLFHPLLQEQFAIMQLKLKPVRARKYCYNMFYAGYQFGKCKLKAHSLRCLMAVEKEYECAGWVQLEDFISKHLAKYFIELQEYQLSYIHVKKLLANIVKSTSKEKHDHAFEEVATFLKALEKQPNFQLEEEFTLETQYIPIPQVLRNQCNLFISFLKILVTSVDVITSDEATFNGTNSKLLPLQSLGQLDVIREVEQAERSVTNTMNWGEMGMQLVNQSNKKEEMNRQDLEREGCFLKSLSALCTEDKLSSFDCRVSEETMFRSSYSEELITVKFELQNPLKRGVPLADFGLMYDFIPEGQTEKIGLKDSTSHDALLSKYIQHQRNNFEIGEEKKLLVSLKIVPLQPGTLLLKGVQWKLLKIPSLFPFKSRGRLMKDKVTRFNNFAYRIRILPPAGKLSIRALNYDGKILFGEVKTLQLELKNDGVSALHHIKLLFSEPYTYGKPSIDLSEITINPGQSHIERIPVRSSDSKQCSIRILVQYQTQNSPAFRYARFTQDIPVSQSFVLQWNTLTLFDENIIQLMVDDSIHNNFNKIKESHSKNPISQPASKKETVNLLDLDNIADFSTAEPSLASSNRDENGLKIHQLILIDKNWRFKNIPYKVESAEKGYFWNLTFDKVTENYNAPTRSFSIKLQSKQSQATEMIDFLLDDQNDNHQNNNDDKQQDGQGTVAQEEELIQVEERDMHFLNLEQNIISNTFSYQPKRHSGEFVGDFATIKNFINFDRQLLFDRYWDKDSDFDHPDLLSITALWSYTTNEKTYYGLHGLPKVRMNQIALANSVRKIGPFQSSPLSFDLVYPQQLSHDFLSSPVCTVDVVFKIKNLFWQENISFFFCCVNGEDSQQGQPIEDQTPLFTWEGETEKVISQLPYQGETRFTLQASFTKEGLYFLKGVKSIFFRNMETKQIIEPTQQGAQYVNRKIQSKTYYPLESEQFFINILNKKKE